MVRKKKGEKKTEQGFDLVDHYAESHPKQYVMHRDGYAPNPYEHYFHSEFCMMSFVIGILGLIMPIFSPIAIVFGIGGLMQTHRERMKGKWMAIAGIGLGFLGLILIIVALIFSIGFLEGFLAKFGGLESLSGAAIFMP